MNAAPANTRLAYMRMSSSGFSMRRACRQNSTISTTPASVGRMTSPEPSAAPEPSSADAIDDRGEPGGQHRQAQHIQASRHAGVGAGQHAPAEHERDHADRDVDEEDPRPVQVLEDQPADDRPEDGAIITGIVTNPMTLPIRCGPAT